MLLAFVYIIYSLLFLVFLGVVIRKRKDFSFRENAVSGLGISKSPHAKVFNLVLMAYGILSMLFALLFKDYLPPNISSDLLVMFFLAAGFMSVFVGLLPFDKYLIPHLVAAEGAFAFIFLASVVMIPVNLQTEWIWDWMLVINFVVVFGSLKLLYHSARHKLTGDWGRSAWLSEWVMFIVVLVSNLLFGVMLLVEMGL